ncbi:IMP1 Protease, mitochondrial [Teratosphaeria destructans]|uniref:IMP1 Protease, mitochondrial n=1 Tax=Teratosphaeria destructans TaxID=418781 RepID=A0A9W7W6U0_9PEZI|nr:IMP1 Protease, mitochondrial [Teratosphaeria destructans]
MLRRCLFPSRPALLNYYHHPCSLRLSDVSLRPRAQSSHIIGPLRPLARSTSTRPQAPAFSPETRRQKVIRYLLKPWAAHSLSSRPDGIGFFARVITRSCLTAAFVWVLLHTFVTYFYALDLSWGISMLPSVAASGDSLIISKYYRRGRGLSVGDVVSFKHPIRPDEYAVKRLLGMPGDFVEVSVDGSGRRQVLQVPEGHCWVEGDNQMWSRDSRLFGPLPLGLVTGKVVAKCRGWSLWDWEPLENLVKPAEGASNDVP